MVGRIGDELHMDYRAQGHPVGLAQRMEQLAASDSAYLIATGPAAQVLTPEVLAAAYDVQVHVSTSSDGERIIVPLRRIALGHSATDNAA